MFNIHPVGYLIGLLLAALGVTMFAPLLADLVAGNGHWPLFLESAVIIILVDGLAELGCAEYDGNTFR